MEGQTLHFRHILLFYFNKGKNASQACEKLCKVYEKNALQERQCQRWFSKFRAGNFDVNDAPRSGRPTEVDDDKIKALVESNPRYTLLEMGEILDIDPSNVSRHLKKLGYTNKPDSWVPHKLKDVHLISRISICDMLLKREAVNRHLVQYFDAKDKSFYEKKIMKLRERWQEVVQQNGQYINDLCLFFTGINDIKKRVEIRHNFRKYQ